MATYTSKDLLEAYKGQLQPITSKSVPPNTSTNQEPVKEKSTKPFYLTQNKEELQKRQESVANFFGFNKLAKGTGESLALNKNSKLLEENQAQQSDLQSKLIQRIHEKKAIGGDTSRLEEALTKLTGDIKNTSDTASEVLNPENLTKREVVGSALQTAANFIPGVGRGSSLLERAAAGAATGYAYDVGSKLQDTNNPNSKDFIPGVGTATGAIIPIAADVLKGVFGKSAQALEKQNLRLSPKDRTLLKKDGDGLVKYLTKKQITGNPETRLEKVNTLYNDMENKVQTAIKDSGVTYNKADLIEDIKLIPDKVSDDPELQSEVSSRVDKLVDYINNNYKDDVPATSLNNLKRNFAKKAFSKNTDEVVNEARYYIADELLGKLNKDVTTLKPLNKEYGRIIQAKKLLEKAVGRNQLGFTGKIVASSVGGLAGSAAGGPAGAALGLMIGPKAGQFLAGTASRSRIGAGLQTLTELLSKESGPNIAIPRDLLMNLLETFRN